MKRYILLFTLFISFTVIARPPKVLVFSKTSGYRHSSIETGVTSLLQLGKSHHFIIDTTSDARKFSEQHLKKYAAVIFLQTTGDLLNHYEQAAFERYIQAGGGFVGVHAAADAEYDWKWYGQLVGGYFNGHPQQQEATLRIVNHQHGSTAHLPAEWKRYDEWYNFRELNPSVQPLLTIDELSYQGGTNGSFHPVAWCHQFDGGRSFYTALGHTEESYSDSLFLKHLLGGIQYAIGNSQPLNYAKARTTLPPSENAFHRTVLTMGELSEPTEMAVLPGGNVLIAQRKGAIKYYNAVSKQLSTAGLIPVYHTAKDTNVNAEEGLMGLAADPQFATNDFIYLYYAAADTPVNRLSRFIFLNGKINPASEKIILELYSQREICCHTGGSVTFDNKGLLYLSTGDNTTPFNQPNSAYVNNGFAPLDNREGLEQYDDRRTSGNTNDLRGKILRIQVNGDGSYSIPAGNLFAPGTPGTRPEIYIMGARNPYRISIDQRTNYLYWGEVGPDAPQDDTARGPRGFDEINQAKAAGNFGYPFFIANNYTYRAFNYATGESGKWFDARRPVNDSKNNTGLTVLPPAQPALIWYPYGPSMLFPQLGSGGRTAMAGPVYYGRGLPPYYAGKLLIYDWVRGWIKAVTLDEGGNFCGMEPFMEHTAFNAPIDMEVGPDGKLYVLEYGKGWFSKNPDAALVRIDYDTASKKGVPKMVARPKPALDSAEFAAGHQPRKTLHPGEQIMRSLDCATCHQMNKKSVGPSFEAVAGKYANTSANRQQLINKIISGGSGAWGQVPMPAHPALQQADAEKIIQYILSLDHGQ